MGVVNESLKMIDMLEGIKQGKYAMPAFQRQYCWDIERIEKLWDSILLDYPISTFLFWTIDDKNTSRDTYFCPFLSECTFNSRKEPVSKNYKLEMINFDKTNIAILDGQQRMTSIYLSLFGDIYMKNRYARGEGGSNKTKCDFLIELDKNKSMYLDEEYNLKKYSMKFYNKKTKSKTLFDIKNLINDKRFRNNDDNRKFAIMEYIVNVPENSKSYASSILYKICSKIFDEDFLNYTRIFDMNYNDALEMFIRFNSGGKSLKKSEITMTILEAYWSNAKAEFDKVLVDEYQNFSTDFLMKIGYLLFGDVVKSNINKSLVENMRKNWERVKLTLKNLSSFLASKDIKVENYASGFNILLPIIYVIYNNNEYEKQSEGIMSYLMRASLLGYLQNGASRKINQLCIEIKNNAYILNNELLDNIEKLKLEF